jgi:hypothetical protein
MGHSRTKAGISASSEFLNWTNCSADSGFGSAAFLESGLIRASRSPEITSGKIDSDIQHAVRSVESATGSALCRYLAADARSNDN